MIMFVRLIWVYEKRHHKLLDMKFTMPI